MSEPTPETPEAAEVMRQRLAVAHGISSDDAELMLTGTDEATMRRQAEVWSARRTSGPRPDLSQGGDGGGHEASPLAQAVQWLRDDR